jgi:hypothetical protein
VVVTERYLLTFDGPSMGAYPLEGATVTVAETRQLPGQDDVLCLSTTSGALEITPVALNSTVSVVEGLYRRSNWILVTLQCAISVANQPEVSVQSGVRPSARLIRNAFEAEQVAAEWMTFFGFGRARVTGSGTDGGLDVIADTGVAQVKMEALPAGRPAVQQLHGAAVVETKQSVFFAAAGFTDAAVDWADRAGVALFSFDLQGEPRPVNHAARRLYFGSGHA